MIRKIHHLQSQAQSTDKFIGKVVKANVLDIFKGNPTLPQVDYDKKYTGLKHKNIWVEGRNICVEGRNTQLELFNRRI